MNEINTAITTAKPDAYPRLQESGKVAAINDQPAPELAIEDVDVSRAGLEQMVLRLNEHAQSAQRDLQFSLDEDTGKTVITVLDRNTAEVIRQLPNEVTLNLARQLNDGDPIHLFSAQA